MNWTNGSSKDSSRSGPVMQSRASVFAVHTEEESLEGAFKVTKENLGFLEGPNVFVASNI